MHSFINSNNNYHFSKFDDEDLKAYLLFLRNYYIDYRDKLRVDNKTLFGLEIEYECSPEERIEVDNYIKNYAFYESKDEKDFDYGMGGEIVTPILNNSSNNWKNIKNICKKLKELNVNTENRSGAHVHIGAHILSDLNKFKQFLLLYSAYESIIYRFSNGEYITGRFNQYSCAYPISLTLIDSMDKILDSQDFTDIERILSWTNRFYGLNLKNVNYDNIGACKYKNTIEFRMANGTDEEIIWQNIVNLYCKLIESSRDKEFDIDYLKYKIIKFKNRNSYSFFDHLDIRGALELSDIIFDNNLDKSNFIRQYIKDGVDLTKLKDRPFDIKSSLFIKK